VTSEAPRHRRRSYSRWRAFSLAAHVVHWRLAGRTLAPLELNELMYTLELGVVTAGFIFMTLAVVSVLIFGRFFCSWACHILALEDLCAWLLGKAGIRPKPVRSRVLLLVPIGAMFYMFIWPQIARLVRGEPLPTLHVQGDGGMWASFVTDDYWRNLPGPWIAGITFLVCGFAIVYFLGSRSFCRYACPYGAIFAIADRLAPGRIVAKGDCSQCGRCTAVCESHVRVHQELTIFGRVVDPACLKDLDCVAACPQGAVGYGFTRPSFLASWKKPARDARPRGDFSWFEEGLIVVVFVATLFIFRGLYDAVPFLLTLGLGGIFAYGAIVAWRLLARPNVRLNNFQLKRSGRWTWWGSAFLGVAYAGMLFMIHSGFVRWHEYRGAVEFDRVRSALRAQDGAAIKRHATAAIEHFSFCEEWGLVRPASLDRRLASLYELSPRPELAEPYLRRILVDESDDREGRLRLAILRLRAGDADEAAAHLALLKPTDDDAPAFLARLEEARRVCQEQQVHAAGRE